MYFLVLIFPFLLSASIDESIIAFENVLHTLGDRISGKTIISLSPSTELIIEVGDITEKNVDVIVNAANKELQGGAGVCGAIFKTSGWNDLQMACNKFPADSQGVRCPVGKACITDSFDLSKKGIKKIIHAVGPDCRIVTNGSERSDLLRGAYLNSLRLADSEGFSSIAFPFISSGIYACPKNLAVASPLKTIMDYVRQNPETSLKQIYIVLFSQADKDEFDKQYRMLKMTEE